MTSPKPLIAISAFLLLASAVFAVLNGSKGRSLRNEMALAKNQKEAAEHARQTAEKNIKDREATIAQEQWKLNENDGRVASAETELVKTQTEKSDLQAKLPASGLRLRKTIAASRALKRK